jgi:hypothetical protein
VLLLLPQLPPLLLPLLLVRVCLRFDGRNSNAIQ